MGPLPALSQNRSVWVNLMPTVLRKGGFHFRIYPNDHGPPHVHAVKGSGSAKILLGEGECPPLLDQLHDLTDREAIRAIRIVESARDALLEAWKGLHGEADTE